ncbi:hypothetical protein B0T24DRAFT_17415 [Lasiosphaeria ovina]|uniref:Orc1-like AAA ATPase domain-containing protein n=1 Tax=Lasiosphaeria ovina TaxID=92902 RepID=A0AAE0NJ71_9PEZI|nr:hypothetical protein B0T24DRAFT_17415 [Lasiosphaeria ovina]
MVKFVNIHDKNLQLAIAGLSRILDTLHTNPTDEYSTGLPRMVMKNREGSPAQASSTSRLTESTSLGAVNPLRTPFSLPTESLNAPRHEPVFGREDELEEMSKHLVDVSSQPGPKIVSVYGQPGIGKTQLLAYYIAKYRDKYDNVFYLNGTSTSTLWPTLKSEVDRLGASWPASILAALSWTDKFNANVDRLCSFLNKKDNCRWLLIVDEMHRSSPMEGIISRLTTGSIVLVSSSSCLATRYPSIKVGSLGLSAGAKAMRHYTNASGIAITTDLDRLVTSLDGHPALIRFAAERLHTLKSNSLTEAYAPIDLPNRLLNRIKAAIDDDLPAGLPLYQQELFNQFLVFDYQNISSHFLDKLAEPDADGEKKALSHTLGKSQSDGLQELRLQVASFCRTTSVAFARHGLIDITFATANTPTTYRLSGVLFNSLRQTLPSLSAIINTGAEKLARKVPRSSNDNYKSLVRLLIPHCRTLAAHATGTPAMSMPKPIQYLQNMERIASCFRILGQDAEAIKLYGYIHNEIAALFPRFKMKRRQRAELYNNMGLSWMNEGDAVFAIKCFSMSLGALRGKQSELEMIPVSRLGSSLISSNERAEDIPVVMEEAEEEQEGEGACPTPFRPSGFNQKDRSFIRKVLVNQAWAEVRMEAYRQAQATIATLNELLGNSEASPAELHARGYLLSLVGPPEKGIELLEEAYELESEARRSGRSFALTILHDLATVYRDQKKWEEAISRYKTVIEGRTETHGPRHRYTIETIAAVAVAYHGCGRKKEAASHFRIALQWHQGIHPAHPIALQTLQNYGAFLADNQQHETARGALQLAYEGHCQRDFKSKGNVSWAQINCGISLAVTLRELKKYKEAINLLDSAILWHQARLEQISGTRDFRPKDSVVNHYCKALYLRGSTYEAWGHQRAATQSYSQAASVPDVHLGQTNYWKALAAKEVEKSS